MIKQYHSRFFIVSQYLRRTFRQ